MVVTVNSPIVGTPTGSLSAAIDALGVANAEYLTELWRLCGLVGIDPAVMAAQFHLETNGGTSERWTRNRNPAGLAVESDSDPDPATWTQTEAARVHVWALWWISNSNANWVGIDFPNSANRFKSRWISKEGGDGYPRPHTIADLQKRYVDSTGEPQAVWAWDENYATKLVARHRAIFGATEGEGMGRQVVDYSRLPVPVIVDFIPKSQTNQRPGISLAQPGTGTWHETANTAPGADAKMHSRYLHNGAGGQQLGYHFAVDEGAIYQMIPLDEVTWHAGDSGGPGNMGSIAVECCVNSDGNLRMAQENTAALFGLLRAEGILTDVFQHNHWSGKNCPTQLRNGNAITWADAQTLIRSYATEYGQPATPPAPVAAPIWWEPGDIGPQRRASDGSIALAMLGEVTAKRDVPVRISADSKSKILKTMKQGEKARIAGTYRGKSRWVFVEVAPDQWGRALWSAFVERFPTL